MSITGQRDHCSRGTEVFLLRHGKSLEKFEDRSVGQKD